MDPSSGALTLSLDVAPAEGFADHGNLTLDVTDVLVSIGEAAKEHGTGLVLLFDEVQFLSQTQLEAVIQAIHKTVQRKLPVTFVGAGLPQIAELAGDAKSYAERLFKFPKIGSLDFEDAKKALAEPAQLEGVHFSEDALPRAFALTEGYPYFIQELGYQVWAVADGDVITLEDVEDAKDAYEAKLDSSFSAFDLIELHNCRSPTCEPWRNLALNPKRPPTWQQSWAVNQPSSLPHDPSS
jgi:hypothetical protein